MDLQEVLREIDEQIKETLASFPFAFTIVSVVNFKKAYRNL